MVNSTKYDAFKCPSNFNMSDDVYRAYARDFQNGIVTVGDVCNANCTFCSQKWNPPGVIRDLKRLLTTDEIMHFIDTYVCEVKWIASALHTNSGEFYLHPDANKILAILSDKGKLPKGTYLFTNGMALSDAHINAAVNYKLKFHISVTSADLSTRKKIMGGSLKNNQRALESIGKLVKHGVNVIATLVPIKSNIDNGDLENTIIYLKHIGVRSILVYRPGYSKFTPLDVANDLKISDNELVGFFKKMSRKHDIYIRNDNFTDDEKLLSICNSLVPYRDNFSEYDRYRKLFLCSKQVQNILPLVLSGLSLRNYSVKVVESVTYGGNIDCAGLLLVDDYFYAIDEFMNENKCDVPDVIFLPARSFDDYLEDLSMISATRIAKKYGVKVMII